MKPRTGKSRFLRGPVPWDWVILADGLRGRALVVGLCLWRLAGATGSRTVTLANSELEPLGIDRAAKSRALRALEQAGLISIQRKAGRWSMVTLLEPSELPRKDPW